MPGGRVTPVQVIVASVHDAVVLLASVVFGFDFVRLIMEGFDASQCVVQN